MQCNTLGQQRILFTSYSGLYSSHVILLLHELLRLIIHVFDVIIGGNLLYDSLVAFSSS